MGFFPRRAAPVLIALAIVGACIASVGTVMFGHQAASNVYDTTLWPDASYVDHAELGSVALLAAGEGKEEQLQSQFGLVLRIKQSMRGWAVTPPRHASCDACRPAPSRGGWRKGHT